MKNIVPFALDRHIKDSRVLFFLLLSSTSLSLLKTTNPRNMVVSRGFSNPHSESWMECDVPKKKLTIYQHECKPSITYIYVCRSKQRLFNIPRSFMRDYVRSWV